MSNTVNQILSEKTQVLFDRFVLFGEQRIFWTIRQVEFSIRQFISLVRVTPCKFVDSADSFYSANGKCYLPHDKKSFDLFDSTNGKYYARSDILCSPSENCISLMTMSLASLPIRPIRSIRRTDNFIHDLTSRVSIRQLHLIIVKVV